MIHIQKHPSEYWTCSANQWLKSHLQGLTGGCLESAVSTRFHLITVRVEKLGMPGFGDVSINNRHLMGYQWGEMSWDVYLHLLTNKYQPGDFVRLWPAQSPYIQVWKPRPCNPMFLDVSSFPVLFLVSWCILMYLVTPLQIHGCSGQSHNRRILPRIVIHGP